MTRSKLYVIGDIHGCRTELRQMLDLIDAEVTRKDTIVFLGDYIDRGPDSCGVIQDLIDRKNSEVKHVFLMGNHEDMMLNDRRSWAHNGGAETLMSYGKEGIPDSHYEFIKNLEPYYKENDVVCVHAGIDPEYDLLYQLPYDMMWTRKFVGYNGDYKNNEFVIYGHTPLNVILERKNQIGIDTACVFGGELTCVVIDTGDRPEVIKYIQVQSSFDYSRTS